MRVAAFLALLSLACAPRASQDPCEDVTCPAHATCEPVAASATCRCAAGWHEVGGACVDDDECAGSPCGPGAACTDREGSFSCACEPGWEGVPPACTDVDECARGLVTCGVHGRCLNAKGGARCECDAGWRDTGQDCVDLDECAAFPCGRGECVNLEGTYACACDPGWSFDGARCTDVDECAAAPCEHGACVNVAGGYACVCDRGWYDAGGRCANVNECETPGRCAADERCVDLEGSFRCECPAGWVREGPICVNVDECRTGAAHCGGGAWCVDTPGSWFCACNPGWAWDGQRCEDVNECEEGGLTCSAHAHCQNLPGAASCVCDPGMLPTPGGCWREDPCLGTRGSSLCPGGVCVDLVEDGFACECPAGTRWGLHGCEDVDECADGSATCAGSACVNTPGGYHCGCASGWRLQGGACVDVDECATAACGPHGRCTNVPGGFRCACDAGDVAAGGPCRPRQPEHLSVGFRSGCVVRSDGSLWCWGGSRAGSLGDGEEVPRYEPARIAPDRAWAGVSRKVDAACAIATDGSIWTWGPTPGANSETLPHARVPTRVGTANDWASCTFSGTNACAVRTDGSLWCWGRNANGEVGDGTTVERPEPVRVGSAHWSRVRTGADGTCGIQQDGSLWCWGWVAVPGATIARYTSPLRIGVDADWVELDFTWYATCALRRDGSLWCWGMNLGRTPATIVVSPTRVGTDTGLEQVSLGYGFACVLGRGQVSCVGANDLGQLGHGDLRDERTLVPVSLPADAVEVSAGYSTACALLVTGDVACWGANHAVGLLGVGWRTEVPAAVELPAPGLTWRDVSGGVESICGIAGDGTLWCSGARCQNGTDTNTEAFVRLGDGEWKAVSAYEHGAAIRADGSAWAWGPNSFGQTGVTAFAGSCTLGLSRIGTRTDWTAVAAGAYGTLLLARDGSVVSLGATTWNADCSAPATTRTGLVAAGPWVSIAAATRVNCGVAASGELYCWGCAKDGEFGSAGVQRLSVPTQIGTETDWSQVAVADREVCALKRDGSAACWGGAPTTTDLPSLVPTRIVGTWKSLRGGAGGIVGARDDGSLWVLLPGGRARPGPSATFPAGHVWSSALPGWATACAIDTATARLWCDGMNPYGELGLPGAWSTQPVVQRR